MGHRLTRFVLLIVMMTFFAALALDIAVPAMVLGVMALGNSALRNWLVLSGSREWKGETA
jgi:hypothetical protein